MSAKIECSQIRWGKKIQKNRVVIGYLRKIKTNSLKKEEPSVRILMSKPLLLSERSHLAECPEVQRG